MTEGFVDLYDFAAATTPPAAILGLDFGTKTIGIAISDLFQSVANPLVTIKREKFTQDASELAKLVVARDIRGLILGLPRNMDGSEGPRAQSTRAFLRNISRFDGLSHLPAAFWDERLSTVAEERALLEADTSRKRRAELIDAVAASYILQGSLDRMQVIRSAK